MAPVRISVAALALLAACGPSDADRAPLALSWRFADGRRCADTGVLQVQVAATRGSIECTPATCVFACADGEAATVPLRVPARDASLALAALSPQGNALYRGTLDLPGDAPASA